MADGLSIAASVAGLVSLGIQVCSGITTYLDGLKCRAEELEYARQYEKSLKASIQAIENVSPQLLFHHQNSSATIVPCMQLCKDQLEALDRLVAELCGEKKSNPSLRDRAKTSKKRLTYAFDRPKLGQLQTKVDQASQSLQLALQILGLESSSSFGSTLRTIESIANNTAANIIATKADVTAVADNVSTLRNEGPSIRAAIQNIGLSLLDVGQTATQTVQGIQVVREDTNRAAHMLAMEMQLMRSQLTTFQSQSVTAHRATTQLLQLVQQDQGRLITQMISRPSYLEEISEACFDVSPPARDSWTANRTQMPGITTTAMHRGSADSMMPLRYARRCTCRSRQKRQRRQIVWSGFLLYQDNIYSQKHLPTCELWQGKKVTEKKWGVRQVGLGWLAQKAIEITFSCKFGAGGVSFGPNFTYYPTVDEDVAPAFQILDVMHDVIDDLIEEEQISSAYLQYFLDRVFQNLENLFRDGRASPNDMNDRNQTLIYPISYLTWRLLFWKSYFDDPGGALRIIFEFLEDIRSFEIPCNIYDTSGRSPIFKLTTFFEDSTAKAVEIVFGTADDVPFVVTSLENPFEKPGGQKSPLKSINIQKESQLVAEAYGCGQLSQAILVGDIKQVEWLLQKSHASLMEVNCWGQTPLHLSLTHPAILQLLLQYCSPSQLNKPDNNGYTALHYAILSGYEFCERKSTRRRCHRCHCARPLKMLLKADCAVDIGFLKSFKFCGITQRCLRHLIRGLKDRREKLKELALANLLDCDTFTFITLRRDCVLDGQTAKVHRLLEAKGVQVPPSLGLTPQRKIGTSNDFPGVSVYHVIKDVYVANLFCSHGFADFDDFNGHFDEVRGDGLPPIVTCQDIEMITWLFDHGANLFRELKPSYDSAGRESLCVRTAHLVYRQIGNRILRHSQDRDIFSTIHAAVLSAGLFDKCECSCSKQGCTPFLMMVKALNPPYDMEERRSNIFIIERFLKYLELSSYVFMRDQYKEAVRYFTFTALDMSHTCHHGPADFWDYTCSATIEMCENVIHIQDEQADMVELLEEMLFDLEAKLDNMMEDDEDFDMEIFLKDHWLVRVEKELEAISGHELSEGFKKETEALGVVWNEAAEQTDSDSEDEQGKPLQYWLDAIDRAAQL